MGNTVFLISLYFKTVQSFVITKNVFSFRFSYRICQSLFVVVLDIYSERFDAILDFRSYVTSIETSVQMMEKYLKQKIPEQLQNINPQICFVRNKVSTILNTLVSKVPQL